MGTAGSLFPMRIAVDARSYFMRTGIARYTRGLVHGLVTAGAAHDWLFLISDRHSPEELSFGQRNVEVRQSTAAWLGGDAERRALSMDIARWGADLFHCVFPPHGLPEFPTLTTVFDFSPLSHPFVHQDAVRLAFADAWESAAQHAQAFVTTSDAMSHQVQDRIDKDRRVWTVSCGVSAPFNQPPPEQSHAVPRRGVLCVGTIEPRKNVALLLDAARRLGAMGRSVPVTIIGKRGWGYPEFDADLARTPFARWLGYVDDQTLIGHYRSAAIAAFPSLLEGFGLPVLEAMAQDALPLVAPDAALVDLVHEPQLRIPLDAGAWAVAIARWLDNGDERSALAQRIGVRARSFSWDETARGCLQAYEAAA